MGVTNFGKVTFKAPEGADGRLGASPAGGGSAGSTLMEEGAGFVLPSNFTNSALRSTNFTESSFELSSACIFLRVSLRSAPRLASTSVSG